jgi:CHAT domain-containing protein
MESKLMLQNGWIDGLELATFHLPADVAVLSACNSGQRAVGGRGMSSLPGDDIFGLQSALVSGGSAHRVGRFVDPGDAGGVRGDIGIS